ncbi:MarR family transcriptional regulator [Klugiella xanthotipulae]|uniref:DNA-binding MarR family transcriptional regulator n=1 Tax=Klugiella xanthotipulae TaxID=244735 RepID=A0A543HYY6_9MICO|nr:MarR family winged helix-turn-helix transcriptional regulator [Klugiella xanthotipulae]TQM63563.1 DNA-binding MarR family transcriptional regulator [Klugiella xanthotipulae]
MSSADVTHAWGAFQRMRTQLAGRIYRELARSTGLSEPDFEVLFTLDAEPDKTLRSIDLRCALDWEKSRLSHQLRRMTERGLVTRETCTTDGRSTIIVLTAAGIETITAARSCHEAAVSRYFGEVLNTEQLAAINQIATLVLDRLATD